MASTPDRRSPWIQRGLILIALPFLCFAAYHFGTLAANQVRPRSGDLARLALNGLYIEPASLDLGELWETPRHVVTLQVKNIGDVTRTVEAFQPSCDCIAVEPAALTLAPGRTAEVTVEVDLTHRLAYHIGLARRPISVHLHPRFKGDFAASPGWTLTGVVQSRVTLDAHHVAFGDRPVKTGPAASRKIRAKAHVPLRRLEAVAVPDKADVRVESVPDSPDEYRVVVSPRPDLPVGPFRFAVNVQAETTNGVIHPCASIDVTGEMASAFRVQPRVILLGELAVPVQVEAEIAVSFPASGWTIDRIETDSTDTAVSRGKVGPDGEVRLRVTQKVTQAGDQISPVRVVVRKPDGQTESATVEVRYHGEAARR